MNLVKTFDTTELGKNDLFEIFYESVGPYFVEDGVTTYTVNQTIHDYESDKDGWDIKEIENIRKLDNFFITRGAKKDEIVFVYHGTFSYKPWYID